MRFNMLIIDDEWQDRKGAYNNLVAEIRKSGFDIAFDFFEGDCRADLQAKFQLGGFSAIITDAILNIKWPRLTIRDVADIIDDEIPMAVLSGRWGADNIQEVRYAFEKPNCRTFLHWRDIEGDEENGYGQRGEIAYARESIIRMLSESKGLDVNLDVDPDEELRIIHISDIHARRGAEEGDDEFEQRMLNEAQSCAHVILKHWNRKKPAFIAFTGDVTEYGSPYQYNMAEKWINYFFDRLGMGKLPSRKLLYVPGNHDVNVRLAAAARISLDIRGNELRPQIMDEVQQQELVNYAFSPFRDFLSRISCCPLFEEKIQTSNFGWIETRFRHLGIIFYGVKTSIPSPFNLPERKIDLKILRHLGEQLEKISGKHPIVIGLGHHSPVPTTQPDGAVSNLDDIKRFFLGPGKTHIFLHGHCHEARIEDVDLGQLRLVVSGAPSLSEEARKRPEDTLRGFNLLTLHRKDNKVTSLRIDTFSWLTSNLQEMPQLARSYKLQDNNIVPH